MYHFPPLRFDISHDGVLTFFFPLYFETSSTSVTFVADVSRALAL